MLWNLDIISFLLSQNVVKISVLWTLHLCQKTALPLDLALYPVSQLEMPSQERKVERYPQKNHTKLDRRGEGPVAAVSEGLGFIPQLRDGSVPAPGTAVRPWDCISSHYFSGWLCMMCAALESQLCPAHHGMHSAISYSRLARAARRKCCFCSPALYSRKASICLLNACRNAL